VVGEGLGGVARANTQELKLGCGDIIVQLESSLERAEPDGVALPALSLCLSPGGEDTGAGYAISEVAVDFHSVTGAAAIGVHPVVVIIDVRILNEEIKAATCRGVTGAQGLQLVKLLMQLYNLIKGTEANSLSFLRCPHVEPGVWGWWGRREAGGRWSSWSRIAGRSGSSPVSLLSLWSLGSLHTRRTTDTLWSCSTLVAKWALASSGARGARGTRIT